MSENFGIIAVHVGAGKHSKQKTAQYKKLCKYSLERSLLLLNDGSTILDAVVNAVEVLEDSEYTNAGFGSSLTESGTVECDASVMEGKTERYGAVGAVSSIKNPVTVAKLLLTEQINNTLSYGRIPPAFLVGSGATEWAVRHGVSLVSGKEMISETVLNFYQKWQNKLAYTQKTLDDVCNIKDSLYSLDSKAGAVSSDVNNSSDNHDVSDTVGAIGVDVNGETAAAVSSGGLMMKQAGRVGPAAVFGSGCWARNQQNELCSVAGSTSGCGESLIRTVFARECCRVIEAKPSDPTLALQQLYSEEILKSKCFNDVCERLAGSVVLIYDARNKSGEVVYAHTTRSMCVGFMSSSDNKPAVRMSRMPTESLAGHTVVIEGSPFHLA